MILKNDLQTFSIGYENERFFDETRYAKLVAKEIGSDHTIFNFNNKQLLNLLDECLDYMDEPFADSSALAVYALSKETKKHATVALSGDGADELFGGYNKHRAELMIRTGRHRFLKSLSPFLRIIPKSRNSFFGNKSRQLQRYSEISKLSEARRYWALATFASYRESQRLLTESSIRNIDAESVKLYKHNILKSMNSESNLNTFLDVDLKFVLPNDMLKKVDSMSMANSLEVRVPFLDHNLVNYVRTLPDSFKINTNHGKHILREIFHNKLPEKVLNRSKKGFEVPLRKWLRKDLNSRIRNDLLNTQQINSQGIFNAEEVNLLIKKLTSFNPGDSHARIWALFVFQRWWKKWME